jgi:glycosyltransferase involved in cell wall biosynthesis
MKKISIVIPAYNEGESLPILVKNIEEIIKKITYSYEMIILDDGSTDNTHAVLRKICKDHPNIKAYQCRRNFGKSNALNVGFKEAKGEIIITMDADLQDEPKEIPKMLEKLEEGYDLVSGWKKKRDDPLHKTLPSKLFNVVTSKFSGVPLHDFNCGFKVYKKEVVENIELYGEMHRYIPALVHWKGFKVTEILVQHHPRRYGKSKFGTERLLKGLLDFFTVFFLTRYTTRPMHFFGKWGVLMFGSGFLIELYLTIQWIYFHLIQGKERILSDRPLLLLGVLLMVLGSLLFSTGFISEMILYLHRTEQRKFEPHVIQDVIESS